MNWLDKLIGKTERPEVPVASAAPPLPPRRTGDTVVRPRTDPVQPAGGSGVFHAAEAQVAAEWEVGDVVLDTYEVKQVHDSGGMGLVYRVHHRGWNTDLAVKSPRREYFQTQTDRDNFIRECETWIRLGLHPHVVSCYYVRAVDGVPRVFAEYVEGGSLHDWIESRRLYKGGPREALKRIVDIAIQTAWGLQYAHEQELVHQDVKPANVMMTQDGIAKITDFGLAKARAAAGHSVTIAGGRTVLVSSGGMTPAYCSPEQARFEPLSRKTDIWSWAVSVLEMFTGKATWQRGPAAPDELKRIGDARITGDGIPAPPSELLKLLGQCLALEFDDRPESFVVLADRLRNIYETVTAEDYPREVSDSPRLRGDALNNRAVSMLDLDRAAEAEALFEQALAEDPGHPQATYNSGLHRWRNARSTDDAIMKALDQSRKNRSIDWSLPYLQGLIHLERRDTGGAVTAFVDAEKLSSGAEPQQALKVARQLEGLAPRCVGVYAGHGAGVNSVVLSLDGSLAISGSTDNTLRLWDVRSGMCVRTLTGHSECVNSVVLSVDGGWVLSGSGDKTLRLWELSSGKCLRTFDGHEHSVESVSLSSDGNRALSGSWDNTLRFWDVKTGKCLKVLAGHTRPVLSVALSRDSRSAWSAGEDGTIRLWDLISGTCSTVLEGHQSPVQSIAQSADGSWILTGSGSSLGVEDTTLRLWDVNTGKCLRVFDGHTDSVNSLALSADGRFALSGSRDTTVRLWDVATSKCLRTFQEHTGPALSVAFRADGRSFLSGSSDKTLRLYDLGDWSASGQSWSAPAAICRVVATSDVLAIEKRFHALLKAAGDSLIEVEFARAWAFATEARSLHGHKFSSEALDVAHQAGLHGKRTALADSWSRRTFVGHTERVYAVALVSNGRWVLSAGQDKTVRLWETSSGKCLRTFEGHTDGVRAVAVSADGRLILSASSDKTVRVWDTSTGKCLKILEGHSGWVQTAVLSADGRWALSGGDDKTVRLWELSSGKCLNTFRGHPYQVKSVALSADGSRALSGSDDGTIRVWETSSGRCLRTLKGSTSEVKSVALSADGRLVCSASKDNIIRVWEVRSGNCLRTLAEHAGAITSVAVSADDRWLLSGSEDKTARLWDLSTGRCVRTFEGHTSWLASVALSGDGRWVLSGGDDKTVHLWELDWEYDFPAQRDWDDGAKSCVDDFIALHCPVGKDGVTRVGQPTWSDHDFATLLVDLQYRGYGWLRPAGVRRMLGKTVSDWQGIPSSPTGLHAAVLAGDLAKIEALLGRGADVNVETNDGVTALMIAAEIGHNEAVKSLLDRGAKVNPKITSGWTALMHAAFMGHSKVVQALLDKAAEVEARETKTGTTALLMAAQEGHCDVVVALLAKGARVAATGNDGKTALILAAQMGHADVAQVLLENGADINAKQNDGRTALMNASFAGHCEVVRALLEAGADVNARTNRGQTAMQAAAAEGHVEVKALLIRAGATA